MLLYERLRYCENTGESAALLRLSWRRWIAGLGVPPVWVDKPEPPLVGPSAVDWVRPGVTQSIPISLDIVGRFALFSLAQRGLSWTLQCINTAKTTIYSTPQLSKYCKVLASQREYLTHIQHSHPICPRQVGRPPNGLHQWPEPLSNIEHQLINRECLAVLDWGESYTDHNTAHTAALSLHFWTNHG